MRLLLTTLACVGLLFAAAPSSGALFGGTVVWEIGARDFPDGTLDGVELRADGALRDGRIGQAARLAGDGVGAMARGSDGTLWAIAAGGATLYRVRGQSFEQVLAGADRERFSAVAAGRNGAVWVGVAGSPGVYYVTPGNAPIRFALDEGPVRALAVDGGGSAWVAAGEKDKPGRLVRVEADGTRKALDTFDGAAPSQLGFDATGGLWMVGHAGGRLDRRAPDGTRVPVHDFGMELQRLVPFGDGWAVAGGGSVWAVDTNADGAVTLLDRGGGTVGALCAAGDGALAVARGGRVWLLQERERSLVLELPKTTISSLVGDAAGLRAVGCAAPGLCIELSDGRRAGIWTSPVRDCATGALMGHVELDASPGCAAELRWGPTADTGTGWSKWTAADAEGVFPGAFRVRFLQVRVRVPAGGECRAVQVSWLPDNRAPVVRAITRPVARADSAGYTAPTYHVEAGDADGDALTLRMRWIHVRSDWTHIGAPVEFVAGRPARHTAAVPADLPDGRYWVEARVTDAPSNTPARAKTARWRSTGAGLVVDRTRPAITDARFGGGRAVVTVTDVTSRLHVVEFAVDDGRWVRAAAADGHIDSRSERFEIDLGIASLATGSHHLRVRATDVHGNRVVTVAKFEVK